MQIDFQTRNSLEFRMASSFQPGSFVVATDPGVDDLVALALLHKLSPESSHALIPTFANGPIEIIAKNAEEFISYCAPKWTMGPSCDLPLSGKVERPFPDYFHGPDGVWNTHINRNDYFADEVRNIAVPLADFDTAISLGAMTCFSNKSPDFNSSWNLKNLWTMAGVLDEEGNETLYSETNVAFDPDGADSYFAEPTADNTFMVPLDVTRRTTWELDLVEKIPVKDAMSWWVKNTVLAWYENYNHAREDALCLHDPLTIWLAFHPEDAVWEKTGISVVLEGEERGRTVRDSARPEVNVAMKLHDPKGIEQKIWDTIFS